MAKAKREFIRLKCSECGRVNYTVKKNRNVQEKLALRKFCKKCRRHTLHKETKI